MFSLLTLCIGLVVPSLAACSPPPDFDYIVVGGGTAGLLLANKLSADPAFSVAVIEAGDEQYDNPNVTDTGTFGPGLNTVSHHPITFY